ncbi:uncharacterized protein LOC102804601 isoform X2 [Saccoglossus kowalevskii]
MHFSHFLLTLAALVCLTHCSSDYCATECDGVCRKKHCNDDEIESTDPECKHDCEDNKKCCVKNVNGVGNECANECDGQCRKKHCNRDEVLSTNPSCIDDCDAKKGRICCVKVQKYDCEVDCGGTCRKHCKLGEQDAEPKGECVASCPDTYRCCVTDDNECQRDCNGQCRAKHCNRNEKESEDSICEKDCKDKNDRICCVPDPGHDCEADCGGTCRKHCKRGEQDAQPVDGCVESCPPDYRCCVTDEKACKNDCNGQCRKKHCNDNEYQSHEPSCVNDCYDKRERICCVPW